MAVTFLLWSKRNLLTRSFGFISERLSAVCCFLGSHTMWIYLWHILVLDMTSSIHVPLIRFVVVYSVASLVTLLQTRLVYMLNDRIQSPRVRKNLRTIFEG